MDSTATALSFLTVLTLVAAPAIAGVATTRAVRARSREAWAGVVRPQVDEGGGVAAVCRALSDCGPILALLIPARPIRSIRTITALEPRP